MTGVTPCALVASPTCAGMVAMKTGESRTIPFTFPDDYSVELWQGRKVGLGFRGAELVAGAQGACGTAWWAFPSPLARHARSPLGMHC